MEQLIEYDELIKLLPHREKMFLLSRVTSHDVVGRAITSELDITSENIFFEEGRGVPSWAGFEFLAQTVCALTGIEYAQKGLPPPPGMILSVVDFKASIPYYKAGSTLVMKVTEDFCDKETHTYCYLCALFEKKADTEPSVTAKITVMETEDMTAFFNR